MGNPVLSQTSMDPTGPQVVLTSPCTSPNTSSAPETGIRLAFGAHKKDMMYPRQRRGPRLLVDRASVHVSPPTACALWFSPAKGAVGRAGFLDKCCHSAPQKAQLERAELPRKRGFRDALALEI